METNKDFSTRTPTLRNPFKSFTSLVFPGIFIFLVITPSFVFTDEILLSFEILEGDTLAIYIWPPVENLSVNCASPESNSFRVAFFSREMQYGQETSIIYVMPKVEGTYNLFVTFRSNVAWNGTIGVYTSNSGFYQRTGIPMITSQGYFALLQRFRASPSSNQTSYYRINIILNVYGVSQSALFPPIILNPPNLALFFIIAIIIVYLDAFLLVDLHFKNKVGKASKSRLILILLLVAASLYILYQIYVMMSA